MRGRDLRLGFGGLLLAGALAACGGGDDAGPSDARPADPSPDLDDRAAWIRVALATYETGGSTYITGNLITEPPLRPYDLEPVDGACRLATRQTGECVPFCDWNQACVGGACVSPPLVRDAGTLAFTGGDGPIAVPFEDGFYQRFDQTLRFAPGATVAVSAPGGAELPAFSAEVVAPAPLALVGIDALRLRVGTPMTIRWQPADPGSRVRVTLGSDRGHAFFRPVVIECDAPDEHGAIIVPQSMVDRLADPEQWGCGDCFGQEVRRYRRARTTAGDVPIELWVNQTASFYLYPER